MPPLRDREHDILLLAESFLKAAPSMRKAPVIGIAAAAAECLLHYPWPGNVRELQNCIQQAVALAERDELCVADLPKRVREYQPLERKLLEMAPSSFMTLDQLDYLYMRQVLEFVGGNKTSAARLLGMNRRTLYRKLEATRGALPPPGDSHRADPRRSGSPPA